MGETFDNGRGQKMKTGEAPALAETSRPNVTGVIACYEPDSTVMAFATATPRLRQLFSTCSHLLQ